MAALWRETDGLIFQSPAWIGAWWTTIPDRARRALRIGLVWRGDRLVAVVPLAIARRQGVRMLEWAASSYTDYGDILIARDCPPDALTRLWRSSAVAAASTSSCSTGCCRARRRGRCSPAWQTPACR